VGNQICGVQEDEINKPDRPIAAGATSLKAARIRWAVLTVLYFSYGCYLRVGVWSAMWIAISFAHNFLSFGDFGPTKDLCIGLGCVAQLTAAWLIGGAPYEVGWNWIKIIALYTLFPIPLQDLRDVPGDLAVGRRTTPILMGDMPCKFYHPFAICTILLIFTGRIYISLGVFISQFLLIRYRILDYRLDWSTVALSTVLAILALTVIFRLFAFRDVKSDRYSYRLYTVIYLFQPLSACITLR
jgi:4-hydroxybenzoate polyprenyltransferase